MIQDIVIPYMIGGLVFGFLFELLIDRTNYEKDRPTQMWERIFWVTCWPYCLTIFLYNMFKKDQRKLSDQFSIDYYYTITN